MLTGAVRTVVLAWLAVHAIAAAQPGSLERRESALVPRVPLATHAPAPATYGAIPAGLSLDLGLEHYVVVGRDAATLRRQLDLLGPVSDGRTYDGFHRSSMHWRADWRSDADGCAVTSLEIRLSSTITMPSWVPPPDVAPHLVVDWTRFYQNLLIHEEGHRNITVGHARRALDVLSTLRTPHCDDMQAALSAAFAVIVAAADRENRRYDELTEHGRSQHAVWPP